MTKNREMWARVVRESEEVKRQAIREKNFAVGIMAVSILSLTVSIINFLRVVL